MRDFRDAKAMAHTLRTALAAKGLKITVSQSLELIAQAFGAADWNTLSAAIQANPTTPRETPPPQPPNVDSALSGGRVGFSTELTATLHRAVSLANERRQEYATLEHLLLALTDDSEASVVMKACAVDPNKLKAPLARHVDDLPRQTDDEADSAKPSAGFQRVIQRAVLHVQTSGRSSVTGAQVLVAIFSEAESQAAQLLGQQSMTRVDAVNFMIHGTTKGGGGAAA